MKELVAGSREEDHLTKPFYGNDFMAFVNRAPFILRPGSFFLSAIPNEIAPQPCTASLTDSFMQRLWASMDQSYVGRASC